METSEGREPSEQLRFESVGRLWIGVEVSLDSSGEVWLREGASGCADEVEDREAAAAARCSATSAGSDVVMLG
jgi:hypothetical protein